MRSCCLQSANRLLRIVYAGRSHQIREKERPRIGARASMYTKKTMTVQHAQTRIRIAHARRGQQCNNAKKILSICRSTAQKHVTPANTKKKRGGGHTNCNAHPCQATTQVMDTADAIQLRSALADVVNNNQCTYNHHAMARTIYTSFATTWTMPKFGHCSTHKNK